MFNIQPSAHGLSPHPNVESIGKTSSAYIESIIELDKLKKEQMTKRETAKELQNAYNEGLSDAGFHSRRILARWCQSDTKVLYDSLCSDNRKERASKHLSIAVDDITTVALEYRSEHNDTLFNVSFYGDKIEPKCGIKFRSFINSTGSCTMDRRRIEVEYTVEGNQL